MNEVEKLLHDDSKEKRSAGRAAYTKGKSHRGCTLPCDSKSNKELKQMNGGGHGDEYQGAHVLEVVQKDAERSAGRISCFLAYRIWRHVNRYGAENGSIWKVIFLQMV